MKKVVYREGSRRGSALFTVIVLVLIASAFVATLAGVSVSRTFMAKKLSERVKAAAIAEAGAAQAYSVLAADFSQRSNSAAFPATSYAGGTYDVAVSAISTHEAGIVSTGVYRSVTEVVMVDIKETVEATGGSTPTWPAFEYSVLAGGQINWTGASEFYGGKLHSNNNFTRSGSGYIVGDVTSSTQFKSNGNSGGVDGDVTAPALKGKLGNITGTATADDVPLVEIPDIDLTPYYNEALANGEVMNGNVSLSSDYTPNGGILWVNGNLSISGNATFTGSFIATGDLSVSGNGAINKVGDYPTLVSRDGDISFTGGKDVDGLIYVKMGDYRQAGGNSLAGQIIARGDVDKSGSSMVLSYVDSTPVAPGDDSGSSAGNVGVTAWQM